MLKNSLKKFSTKIVTILAVSLVAFSFIFSFALAQEKAPVQTTEQRCTNYQKLFDLSTGNSIIGSKLFCSSTEAALWVIKILLAFSGTVAVLFLIYGGYLYLTSGGNDEQAEQGKKVLVNTIIGLVVIIMSTAIVTVVSSTLALK